MKKQGTEMYDAFIKKSLKIDELSESDMPTYDRTDETVQQELYEINSIIIMLKGQ